MSCRALASWIVVAIGVASATVVHAQPAEDPATAALVQGRRLYDLRDWEAAIVKFKEAYRLRPEPAPLFNIAQAYRLAGNCKEAISFYRTYRRNYPDAPNLDRVDRLLAELEPCVKPSEPLVAMPSRDEARAVVSRTEPVPRTDDGSTAKRLGIVLAGSGGALLATGTVFGLRARDRAREAATGTGAWDPGIESSGQRAELASRFLWGAGGLAVVAGGILYWTGSRDAARARLSIVPRTDGAEVVWQCGF